MAIIHVPYCSSCVFTFPWVICIIMCALNWVLNGLLLFIYICMYVGGFPFSMDYVSIQSAMYMYMLDAKYGFGLSADLLRKPVIHALRDKSEVRADNPRIVLSTAQTFAPRSVQKIPPRFAQTILRWYLVVRRSSLRQSSNVDLACL